MIQPFYEDGNALRLYLGDSRSVLAALPDQSVDCIVTSPPYYGLRDYGTASQIGPEPSPAAFVESLVAVFREARRVLADDGTLWLNLGDSYSSTSSNNGGYSDKSGLAGFTSPTTKGRVANEALEARRLTPGVAAKNLLGVPWRVALALQEDGWILRNDIIWSKPNAMPESVTDRLSNRHEHLFLFSKSPRYWFNLDPIREPHSSTPDRAGADALRGQKEIRPVGPNSGSYHPDGRNPGDVWEIATRPFSEAHFATFPIELPERCILAGCKPGGTVLDPFSGSGTTGMAAAKHGHNYVGIDLNVDYLALSLRTRLAQPSLLGCAL